mmetsp:Transcript_40615/g.122247  ORF Transcript_40615/g.122247 Transcript_40615/m.122247 type:complete len:209 (-) Transcript_40615:121-747(-)
MDEFFRRCLGAGMTALHREAGGSKDVQDLALTRIAVRRAVADADAAAARPPSRAIVGSIVHPPDLKRDPIAPRYVVPLVLDAVDHECGSIVVPFVPFLVHRNVIQRSVAGSFPVLVDHLEVRAEIAKGAGVHARGLDRYEGEDIAGAACLRVALVVAAFVGAARPVHEELGRLRTIHAEVDGVGAQRRPAGAIAVAVASLEKLRPRHL